MPTTLRTIGSLPTISATTPVVVPVTLAPGQGLDHLTVQNQAAASRLSSPLPTAWDKDGNVVQAVVHTQQHASDTSLVVVLADNPVVPAFSLEALLDAYLTYGLSQGFSAELEHPAYGLYRAEFDAGSLVQLTTTGSAVLRFQLRAPFKFESPESTSSYPNQGPDEFGFLTLNIMFYLGLNQFRIQPLFTLGNALKAEENLYFKRLTLLLPGGPSFTLDCGSNTATETSSWGTLRRIDLINAATHSESWLFMKQQGFWTGMVYCYAPGATYRHTITLPPENVERVPGWFARDYTQAYDATTEAQLAIFLANVRTDASTAQSGNFGQGLPMSAPNAFRRYFEGPYGGTSGGANIGAEVRAFMLGAPSPLLEQAQHAILARSLDRTSGGLYDPNGKPIYPAQLVGKDNPAISGYKLDWFNFFQSPEAFPFSGPTSVNMWPYWGHDPFAFRSKAHPWSDVAGITNLLPAMESLDRGYANIDLAHHPRIFDAFSDLVLSHGDPAATQVLRALSAVTQFQYSYLNTVGTHRLAEMLNGPAGRGIEGSRDLAWAMRMICFDVMTAAPGSMACNEGTKWLLQALAALKHTQMPTGWFHGLPDGHKDNTYTQHRKALQGDLPNTKNLTPVQIYQHIIALWCATMVVDYLDLWATYGAMLNAGWDAVKDLAWDAEDTTPDYRVAGWEAESNTYFATREAVKAEYTSRDFVNAQAWAAAIATPNDGNLSHDFHLPLYFAAGAKLVDEGLILQAEWDALYSRWQPTTSTSDYAGNHENWIVLHDLVTYA